MASEQEGPGLDNPGWSRAFLGGGCMFSTCSCGFPLGAPVFPTIKSCIDVSPVSNLDQGTGSESGDGPQVLSVAAHCS